MDALFGEPDPIDAIVQQLHEQPGWPADQTKDRQLVVLLQRQYPGLDLSDEITKWASWMLDHESTKKVRPRARFATWCSKATTPRRGGGGHRPGYSTSTRAGGAPSDWTGAVSGVYSPS